MVRMLYLFFAVLAIFLLTTRKQWTIVPSSALQWFILFSIVFYFYRWTFGWSMPEATIFDEDAPFWVRVIKDVVFVFFIGVCAIQGKMRKSALLWYVVPLVMWISICGYIRLLAVDDTHQVIFNWRCPIEYVCVAFLAFEENLETSFKFLTGCCWIVLGFLGLEVFSGRPTGFGKTGWEMRYGSIFGSPNDLGLFTVLMLLGVLLFPDRINKVMRSVLIVSLSIMLFLSVSRGAFVGLVCGMCSIWPRSKRWLFVIGGSLLLCYVLLITAFRDAQFVDDLIARAWDASATERVVEIHQVSSEIQSWTLGGFVLGTLPHIHQENFYLSLLLRTGFPGLAVFLALAVATTVRARHPFLRASLVAVFIASCFTPYPDYFPVNTFFWMIVGITWKVSQHASETEVAPVNAASPLPNLA